VTTKMKLPRITCPHCGCRTIVRDSVQVSPTYREVRLNCDNDDCGHTMLAGISIIRTLRPSARPNPEVSLPLANQNLRRPKARPANDDQPEPANDDEPLAPAAAAPPLSETS